MDEGLESQAGQAKIPGMEIEDLMNSLFIASGKLKTQTSHGIQADNLDAVVTAIYELLGRCRTVLPYYDSKTFRIPEDQNFIIQLIDEILADLQKKGFYPLVQQEMPV